MNLFPIDKISEILQKTHTKDGNDNLKILFGSDFEIKENHQLYSKLNATLTQLQYNLTSPYYLGKEEEMIAKSQNELKVENLYLPQCEIVHAIELLESLTLYKPKK